MQKFPVKPVKIISQRGIPRIEKEDLLVTEEPLEIILGFGSQDNREQMQLAITMRTPGNDFDLVIGFLFSEGIIKSPTEILSIRHCENVKSNEEMGNVVKVEVHPEIAFSSENLKRNFHMNSSCGVCGKASIESIKAKLVNSQIPTQFQVHPEVIHQFSVKLNAKQTIFSNTGGLHAAGFFNKKGELLNVREDIGRHNALDKLIGWQLLQKQNPKEKILFLSGRVGFELVQKAVVSQIPMIAAVGAPSSLAVELAQEYNITLIGFVRNNSFNIYAGENRIADY